MVQDIQTRDARLFAESSRLSQANSHFTISFANRIVALAVDQNRVREFELKLAEADAAKADAQRQRDELALKDTEVRTQLEAIVEEKVRRTHDRVPLNAGLQC